MAALSHLKNKKESKLREGIEKLLQKCGAGSGDNVEASRYFDVMRSFNIDLDKKEISKINKITDEAGYIPRDEFVDYAKRSSAVKELTEKGLSSSRSATSGHTNLDKAELAFKAIDKDNSGSIDASELSKLGGGMSKEKLDKLMAKLDTDGDGKITLEEFRGLFKQMKQ